MNTLNNWRFRSRRDRDKIRGIRNQTQQYPPIPNSAFPFRPYKDCLASKPFTTIDHRIYKFLNTFNNRLTRLEHYIYNTLERLQRDQYRENNLPGAETLWRQIQQGKVKEFREGSSVSRDQIRTPTKNRRGYYRDDPSEPQGRPRTIDITQCRYCSSWPLMYPWSGAGKSRNLIS
jgi:hypothetical protein